MAPPRRFAGLGAVHQCTDRRGSQHRLHQTDLLQRQPGFPHRRSDPAVQGPGGHVRLVSHGTEFGARAGRQLPARRRRVSRHAAARNRAHAAHRLRVRQPRPAHRYHVSRHGAHVSHSRDAIRRDVRLRHARHRLAQPRLADTRAQHGLHGAESDERDHRGRGNASLAARALVWRLSGEHALRGLPHLVRRRPRRARGARRPHVHEQHHGQATRAGRVASRVRPRLFIDRDVWRDGHLLPRQGSPRSLAARGVSRRRADPRSVRAAAGGQDCDAGHQQILAHDGHAPRPRRLVHGATGYRVPGWGTGSGGEDGHESGDRRPLHRDARRLCVEPERRGGSNQDAGEGWADRLHRVSPAAARHCPAHGDFLGGTPVPRRARCGH